MRPKPVILIILDGFGISLEKAGNAVLASRRPNFEFLEKNFPFTAIQASGIAVGLPWGEAGNSEVGHLTMGAGRIILNHLPRIISSIRDGSFFKNEAFVKAVSHVKENSSRLHIFGLVSSGSVHSYFEHLEAVMELANKSGLPEVFLHIISDGKDAPPKEGAEFIRRLEANIEKNFSNIKIASVIGRFFAMDRDEKWDRIKKTYALLTSGEGEKIKKVSDFIKESYAKEISDEFIEPAAITDDSGAPVGIIKDNDALIIFNFREDSMREISEAFVKEKFDHFERKKLVNFFLVTMTEYEKNLPATMIAFPPLDINFPLGRVVSEAGLRQLRIAETEKYAHVTYFFNGGKEKHFVGEDRLLIPSLPAAHFDEVPEMKSAEITAKIIENYENYDLIIANFANADMVGHTGNFSSAVKAVEALDQAIGELSSAVLEKNGVMVVTADHGNIELKMNPITGERITEHSLNPVPLFLVGNEFKLKKEKNEETILKQKSEIGGVLTDIAPTILELLGLKKPEEMTGKSLLEFLKNQN